MPVMWNSATALMAKPKAMSQRPSTLPSRRPTNGNSKITTRPPGDSILPACSAV